MIDIVCATALFASLAPAQTNHFVWSGGTDASPYTNWATAAHEIQSAIIASAAGATVWVTNGTYNTGGVKHNSTSTTNRVAVTNAITVRSVNGPSNTFIVGRWHVPDDTNNIYGDAAVRCVYLASGAALVGFTVSNGATRASTDREGGGIRSDANAVASNCIIISCASAFGGGGAYGGIFRNCSILNNRAASQAAGAYTCALLDDCLISGNYGSSYGGGAGYSTLTNCLISNNTSTYAAGARSCTNYNCRIIGNTGITSGGGLTLCLAYDCVISNNYVIGATGGAGTYDSILYNCEIRNNSSTNSGGMNGGAAYNCLIAGNTSILGGGGGAQNALLKNCVLSNNVSASVSPGGANNCASYNCTFVKNIGGWGGATRDGALYNCVVKNNTSTYGGGIHASTAYNCLIVGNKALTQGGGAYIGSVFNCTIVANSVTGTTSGSHGGGISGGTTAVTNINTIVWHNTVAQGSASNHYATVYSSFSCAAPLIAGPGNTDSDPMFKNYGAGNYYPAKQSPCLNSGAYYSWMADPDDTRSQDLDGGPRIRHNIVDMGAFEARISRGSLFSAE